MDIETFPNPAESRNYIIQHIAEEFTSLCPKTGHPDFGIIAMTYIPSDVCIELKAFKLYLHEYRNEGIFYEAVTNKIADDMAELLKPRWLRIEAVWRGRGGIRSNITAEYCQEGFTPPAYPPFAS